MKSERRHELRENDLQHVLEVTRDYLADNGSRVGMIVIGVLAVVVVASLVMRSSAATAEDAWAKRKDLKFETPEIGLVSLETLRSIGEGTSDKDLALACLIDRGNLALRLAQKVADPPDRKLTDLSRAAFEELRTRHQNNPLALAIALNGLASVEENLFSLDGKPDHKALAQAHLTALIDNRALDGLPLQQLAIERRKTLDATFVKVKLTYPPPPTAKASTESDEGSDPADEPVKPAAVVAPATP